MFIFPSYTTVSGERFSFSGTIQTSSSVSSGSATSTEEGYGSVSHYDEVGSFVYIDVRTRSSKSTTPFFPTRTSSRSYEYSSFRSRNLTGETRYSYSASTSFNHSTSLTYYNSFSNTYNPTDDSSLFGMRVTVGNTFTSTTRTTVTIETTSLKLTSSISYSNTGLNLTTFNSFFNSALKTTSSFTTSTSKYRSNSSLITLIFTNTHSYSSIPIYLAEYNEILIKYQNSLSLLSGNLANLSYLSATSFYGHAELDTVIINEPLTSLLYSTVTYFTPESYYTTFHNQTSFSTTVTTARTLFISSSTNNGITNLTSTASISLLSLSSYSTGLYSIGTDSMVVITNFYKSIALSIPRAIITTTSFYTFNLGEITTTSGNHFYWDGNVSFQHTTRLFEGGIYTPTRIYGWDSNYGFTGTSRFPFGYEYLNSPVSAYSNYNKGNLKHPNSIKFSDAEFLSLAVGTGPVSAKTWFKTRLDGAYIPMWFGSPDLISSLSYYWDKDNPNVFLKIDSGSTTTYSFGGSSTTHIDNFSRSFIGRFGVETSGSDVDECIGGGRPDKNIRLEGNVVRATYMNENNGTSIATFDGQRTIMSINGNIKVAVDTGINFYATYNPNIENPLNRITYTKLVED